MILDKYTNKLLKLHGITHETLRLKYVTQESIKQAPKEIKRPIKRSKDVEKYMSSSEHLLKIKHEIPDRFFKRNIKAPDDLYLVDCNIAKEIVNAIKPYILKPKKNVIETNPGFGFITRELLKAGLNRIQLYESTISFQDHILELDKNYPEKIQLYNRDFFSIWRLSYQDRHDNGDRVKRMLCNIQPKEWTQEAAMTIIGSLTSSNFLRHLIISLIFQFGIMTYGRCELYLLLPPNLYLQLTAQPRIGYLLYRASSVLFQLLCDHKILLKVPRNAFLPWDNTIASKQKSKLKKLYTVDADCMYLTRIEFKKNLPVPMDKIQHLWFFIQQMLLSRSNRVIPVMEKWIPGCGIRLILSNNPQFSEKDAGIYKNMNIFTEIGQMNPLQILKLYREFSSWPEYNECTFIASLENALLKMENLHIIQDIDDHVEEQDEKKTQPENLSDKT